MSTGGVHRPAAWRYTAHSWWSVWAFTKEVALNSGRASHGCVEVMRYESLATDFAQMVAHLRLSPSLDLVHHDHVNVERCVHPTQRAEPRRDVTCVAPGSGKQMCNVSVLDLSTESRALVVEQYREDFDVLGYAQTLPT